MTAPRPNAKTERNQEIIRLRDEKHWTFAQIAKVLGITDHRVKQIYARETTRKERAL